MPQLGLTMERGTVVEWLAGEGDEISAGQDIFSVETDKAVVAVEAHQGGILARILVPEGQEVAVGAVVAVGVAPGETLPAGWQPDRPAATLPPSGTADREPPSTGQAAAQGPLAASWKARTMAREAGLDLAALVGGGPGGRIVAADVEAAVLAPALAEQEAPAEPEVEAPAAAKATPVAANLARALGLDLARVSGSGPRGRITQEDVLATAAALLRARTAAPAIREGGAPQVVGTTPLKGVRKIVSEGMAASAHSTARVTLMREVDAGELVRLREQFAARGLSVTYNDIFIRICAVALREHPAANARLGEGKVEHLDRANVGLAVDTERGLLVPVVHDADRLTIPQIAAETARLVAGARSGRIPPDDLSGGTFTITNLGMFGVEGFTPVINLPECCILGVGAIVRKPVVVDGAPHGRGDTVAVRPRLTLSLVFDHRVIDGAPAARFLARIAQLIEDPMLLLTTEPGRE
jgi:pyruvate dehydrogenase E2 component (dihydrolipoamide acetyltransferase)